MIYSSEEDYQGGFNICLWQKISKEFFRKDTSNRGANGETEKQQRRISNHERRIALLKNRIIKFMVRPDSVSQSRGAKLRIIGANIPTIRVRLTPFQAIFARLLKVDRGRIYFQK